MHEENRKLVNVNKNDRKKNDKKLVNKKNKRTKTRKALKEKKISQTSNLLEKDHNASHRGNEKANKKEHELKVN